MRTQLTTTAAAFLTLALFAGTATSSTHSTLVGTGLHSPDPAPPTEPHTPAVSPGDAFLSLVEGNARFVGGYSQHPRQDAARLAETAQGQHPIATILSCSDSRVGPELLFDQGVGDLFVIRLAGNISTPHAAGTVEYGVEHLNTPLLVVLGHSACGAVTAVCSGVKTHGNITELLKPIAPSAKQAKAAAATDATEAEIVEAAVTLNVYQTIEDLLKTSQVTRELVQSGRLKVVGAVYNLQTGRVDWLGPHPQQTALLSSKSTTGHAASPSKQTHSTRSAGVSGGH